jgi:hypothetical protein
MLFTIFLAFVLNFHNRCKTFHSKNFLGHLSRTFPQTFHQSLYIKFPMLITLLISFSFNQATIFLYKYSCLCVNESVLNWTFCQSRYSRKNPIVRNFNKSHLTQISRSVATRRHQAIVVRRSRRLRRATRATLRRPESAPRRRRKNVAGAPTARRVSNFSTLSNCRTFLTFRFRIFDVFL